MSWHFVPHNHNKKHQTKKGNLMFKTIQKSLLASAIACIALPPISQAQVQKLKDITIVVGSAPGGTMDVNARQIAQYMGRHLPGSPNVTVQNMPGGSGMVATNYISQVAKPDGATLYYGVWFPVAQILKLPELKADYDKLGIVGAGADTRAVVMRRETTPHVDKPADILKVQNFVVGSTSSNGEQDLLNRMSLDLLGAKYKLVTGYGNGPAVDLAFLKGEVDFKNNSFASIMRTLSGEITAGKALPMYYYCTMDEAGNIKRASFTKDTPCYIDLYRELYGKMPTGDLFETLNAYTGMVTSMIYILAAPPGTPESLLAPMREAYEKATHETAFTEFYIKQTGYGPELATLEDARKIMKSADNFKSNAIGVFRKYYETGGR